MDFIRSLNPILQGLLATLFTWSITALGASVVFFFKKANKKMLTAMLGFGAGVMIAASFWSLLNPAIILAEELGYNGFISPAIGFLLGGILIIAADKILSKVSILDWASCKRTHKTVCTGTVCTGTVCTGTACTGTVCTGTACTGTACTGTPPNKSLNPTEHSSKSKLEKNSLKRCIMLVFAVTLHNIPEGLAVGVAFGCASLNVAGCDLIAAILLAIGIGLQNFPEGASVSLPLRGEGFSRGKSFFYGQASGLVEPIAGVIGVIAAICVRQLLPFLLSFSAGAMIAV
ncbi:MAG: ZIP family metal transporter, partial [Oscillospiraceae bacterium]